jgi:putative oxidoreductase
MSEGSTSSVSTFSPWSPLVLRAIVGYGFMAHGYAKLSRGPDAFAGILSNLHVPFPHAAAWATVITELLGGAAVLAGAFVPVVAIPMIVVMVAAIVTVHAPYGFSSIKLLGVGSGGATFGPPGYETALLYISCIVALVLIGPGPLSVDRMLRARARSRARRF